MIQTSHATARSSPSAARVVGVGSITYRFVDPRRTIRLPSGRTVRRTVRTLVLYPRVSGGHAGLVRTGPFPLVVFGHGFAVSPRPYHLLLQHWARAGFVVAAPVFPLENAAAPGGPDEHDLVNQPADMSLVITELERLSAGAGPLRGMIARGRIAVAGQSDGGDTALATAYDPAVRDHRVRAAMILSGAEDPFAPPFSMPSQGPALLAVQGTADSINPPAQTYAFFDPAVPPKYLLKLIGAGHQPPYTEPGRWLDEVERITTAFLYEYLRDRPAALRRLSRRGSAGPGSVLSSDP